MAPIKAMTENNKYIQHCTVSVSATVPCLQMSAVAGVCGVCLLNGIWFPSPINVLGKAKPDVSVLYSRCEGTIVLQSNLTLITYWGFSPSESVSQLPKAAAPWQWEDIGTKICLEHGINGTQLALAFLKPPGALCGCTGWYRKHHCPSSE